MAATEATISGIVESSRRLLRDFPHFFEVQTGVIYTSTVRLPHPMINGQTLQVYTSANPGDNAEPGERITLTPMASTEWTVDERNGLLKFNNTTALGLMCFVSGYHYEWFLDSDLEFFAAVVVGEHLHDRGGLTLEYMDLVEVDVVSMGVLVHALWSLVTELSTDINIATPEGMNIPVNQRFQQVWQLLQFWEGEYNKRAAALNVGLSAMTVHTLRRESKQTGRLIPVYVPREYDDPRPPQRVLAPIGNGTTTDDERVIRAPYSVEEIGREGVDLGFGGWRTIGTAGDPQ